MLYTRLTMCIDKSAAVITQLAVHVISHNCLCMIYGTTSPCCFFSISENVVKWNTNLITEHKNDIK